MKDRVIFDVLFTIYFHFKCMTIYMLVLMELNVKLRCTK